MTKAYEFINILDDLCICKILLIYVGYQQWLVCVSVWVDIRNTIDWGA